MLHLIGDKAIFMQRDEINITQPYNKKFIISDEVLYSTVCSIELLAFIRFDPHYKKASVDISTLTFNDNTHAANTETDDNSNTSILHIYTALQCYHRTMYGRWKTSLRGIDRANYWPTMIFCPIHTNNHTICNQINQYTGSYTFTMPAGGDYWSNTFTPNRNALFTIPQKDPENSENIPDTTNDLAVCLVIPSVSSDVSRRRSFSGMLLECLRYYTSLGFKVLLYTQGATSGATITGQNNSILFTSPYHHDTMYTNMLNKISYYNYTIRGAMVREAVEFDNNDLSKRVSPDAGRRMSRSDKDKV